MSESLSKANHNTTPSGGIHLGTVSDFIAALNSAFSPFDVEGESLQRLHKLKQFSRPVDEFVLEFQVLAKQAGLTDTSQLIHIFRHRLDLSYPCDTTHLPQTSMQALISAWLDIQALPSNSPTSLT